MSTNNKQSELNKVTHAYFNQKISTEHYRAARTQLLDEMEVQINGRQNSAPDTVAQLTSVPGKDTDPFD